jgi:two-component system NarL family sensor kinase
MQVERSARRLSWSIAVLSFIVMMSGLVLSILALTADGKAVPFSHQFFTPILTITYCVVGALVASRHPRNPIGWMFCTIGFLSALNMFSTGYTLYDDLAVVTSSLPGVAVTRWLALWVWIPNIILPVTFALLLFPDGKLASPRWRPIFWAAALSLAAVTFSVAFHPGPLEEMGLGDNPFGIAASAPFLNGLITIAGPVLGLAVLASIASIIVRFRGATGIERARLKWLTAAAIMVIVGNILGAIPWWMWKDSPITRELSIIATDITVVSIVIAVGIAILRYRLYDIHILINRTLVYGSLTTLIVAIYVAIVGSLGALLQTHGSLPVSLLGTGVVAVSFQSLRDRLQRAVNRLMYGERDDPYAVLGRLSERLEAVATSQSVLPAIVETVSEALKLPYAAIALKDRDQFTIVAEQARSSSSTNSSHANLEILPLIYQMETIGQLILAPRAPGEPFSETDRRLIETIARQAGVAAYNVRMTQDLQQSRERLVTTREEERRRLRRDLHDGLGPVLASLSFKLDAIHNLADRDVSTVRKMLAEVKAQLQDALADIRRIAYNLRPPALDELGLIGALEAHITSQNQLQRLQITLEAPPNPPPLPAAVEVAAYRIALEAMTNVSRHAQAQHCSVRLSLPGDLCVEVIDDGQGLPNGARAGVGLTSMRERAEELGGVCTATALPSGGTGVMARLPLSAGYDIIAGGLAWTPSGS